MKYLILILILFLSSCFPVPAQECDTLIINESYTSFFCKKVHNPLYVSYKLYQGGGTCSRDKFRFKVDHIKGTATSKNYLHSGYDQGHLVNAEDKAYDCKEEELTFRFYNCVPQTPDLNRGIWKTYETFIREMSQTDSLLIICGGIYGVRKLSNSEVIVPTYCWKIVQSLNNKQIICCLLFTNKMTDNKVKFLTLDELEKKLKYKLPIKQ